MKYKIKDLLQYAIDTLIILKNCIVFDNNLTLPQYNINIFEILAKLHEQMDTEADKRKIREEIQVLRHKIQQDN